MWDEIIYFFENILLILKSFGLWLLDLLFKGLRSVLHWIFDKLCDLVEWVVAAIDFQTQLFDTSLAWAQFPNEIIWLLNQVGLDQCFVMLTAAIGIRILLNLIPAAFTRV